VTVVTVAVIDDDRVADAIAFEIEEERELVPLFDEVASCVAVHLLCDALLDVVACTEPLFAVSDPERVIDIVMIFDIDEDLLNEPLVLVKEKVDELLIVAAA
jgi:hypothetical protein